jgi:hypothetical protein
MPELNLPVEELRRRLQQACKAPDSPQRNRVISRYRHALLRKGCKLPPLTGMSYDTVILDDDFVNPVPKD